jgi:transporter family-2 protein
MPTGARGSWFPAGTPWSLYVGGLCGFVIILALALVFPRIGAGTAVGLMVLGQAVAALVVDHWALLGLAREPVSLSRVGGLALVVAGVVLLRR